MYEKFGEFDSAEEINRAAAAQLKEKDVEAIVAIAQENGIDKEDAEDYADGLLQELTTPLLAAVGKLTMEAMDLKLGGVLMDWVDELKSMCTESEALSRAVRRKGKDLAGYIAELAENGYQNRTNVDKRIVERTKEIKKVVGNHGLAIGVPDKRTRKKIAEAYYGR